MSVNRTDLPSSDPAISVIIPLEYHRGQWERCWANWNAQTVARSLYELILVVPLDFQQHASLDGISADRLEFSSHSHDIDLCAAGAAKARGKYLFFTEAHCWPEPDVLERCLEAIDVNPDWAGFSCQSIPITHNRLSKAEAEMYMMDIDYAMQVHPWRKILDQCFVTSREVYEHCGGFRTGIGHYAEWLLAANYFQRGYKIGYFPKARFHHYYSGSLSDLDEFTLDFVNGEIGYFGGEHHDSDSHLLEIPPEWICQGNFDRGMARAVLHIALRGLWPPSLSYRYLPWSIVEIGRWIPPAIFGDGMIRARAAAAVAFARAALLLSTVMGSQKRLNHQFTNYIAKLIHAQRLEAVGMRLRTKRGPIRTSQAGFGADAVTSDATGFYPLEQSQGNWFRWSETAAAVPVSAPAGPQTIHIDCIPVRNLSDKRSDFRFYIDGARISSSQLSMEATRVSINFNLARPQVFKLGWTCTPFRAVADRRLLGLPVQRIGLIARIPSKAAPPIEAAR
jgi:Glycosyl transferase family 2